MKKLLSLIMALALFSLMGILATISTSCSPTKAVSESKDFFNEESTITVHFPNAEKVKYSGTIEPTEENNTGVCTVLGYKIHTINGKTIFLSPATVFSAE